MQAEDSLGGTTALRPGALPATNRLSASSRDASGELTSTGCSGDVPIAAEPSGGVTEYAYDGDNIVEQLNTSGAATARFTQGLGIDEPLEVQIGRGSYYYSADGLGSVVALTKSNGSAVNTYFGYNTFGWVNATDTVANPFRFTGREWDSETSLYYYRARYYDPLWGRFLSEDPIRFEGDQNFFRTVFNSPLNWVDPFVLDVTVMMYQGEGPNVFGHIAVQVNGDPIVGFTDSSSLWDIPATIGNAVPAAVKPIEDPGRRVLDTITIHTTPDQDRAMRDAIEKRRKHPGYFNLENRNCTQFGIYVLKAAGIAIPWEIKPKSLMEELHSRYPKRKH
jgi:RHS repeat-associated protein